MAKRAILGIDEMPLVGGALCLDLANTISYRTGESQERLESCREAVVFCQRVGLLDASAAAACRRHFEQHPRKAQAALRHLIALREAIYAIGLSLVSGSEAPPAALSTLDREVAKAAESRRLLVEGARAVWRWDDLPDLNAARGKIALSAADLLTSEQVQLLRQCGDCDWLFLDRSKNGSRVWCKKTCGDRVKSRRHYTKRRRGLA